MFIVLKEYIHIRRNVCDMIFIYSKIEKNHKFELFELD